MSNKFQNPKLIIKNGVFLFIRLMLVMAMAFYTTRLTLYLLGDEDYGINNIIGGVISMFAIISMPITGALQRFFNVEFTKQEIPSRLVFNTSLRIIFYLSIGMTILYETIGLFLVNQVLNYPIERTYAVNVIFQFTILTAVCNFFSLTYSSLLIAKEDMGVPATVEILMAVMKLVFLFIIPYVSIDILIAYTGAMLFVGIFQIVFYVLYCGNKYKESHFAKVRDKGLQKDILQFSGWSAVNAVAGISLTYLSNILINIFGGLLYNTAYGISQQLSNAVVSFSTNVLKAVDPQITSNTVAEQNSYRDHIVLFTVKLCYLGVGFVYVVFLIYGDYLLGLWLKNVPEHVLEFCRVSLFNILVTSIALPLRTIILATGRIKQFYLNYLYMAIVAIILMFVLLELEFPIITVMYLILAAGIGYFVNAMVIVDRMTTLKVKHVLTVVVKSTITLSASGIVLYGLSSFFEKSFFSFSGVGLLTLLAVGIMSYFIVLDTTERKYIGELLNNKIKK